MNKIENKEPLVSIIVVTYNSSQFVLETLESAKAQTYQNIELIVTDDCSKDNTVEICRDWMEENKVRFVRTELITVEKNTGISPNCNRGLYSANGQWLKFIAGDDILISSCINAFIQFSNKTTDCKIVFGKMLKLQNQTLSEFPVPKLFSLNRKKSKYLIHKGSGIQAPTLFVNKEFLLSFKGFDEQYKYVEDLPLWIKISKKDEIFYFLDEFVVKYRFHDNNICMPGLSNFTNKKFYYDNQKIILKEILPYLLIHFKIISFLNYLNYLLIMQIIIVLGNKNNRLSKFLNLFILRATINRMISKVKTVNNI